MMNLHSLVVIHESKDKRDPFFDSTRSSFAPLRANDFLTIETCLRNIWITYDNSPALLPELPPHFDVYHGSEGYLFLLELSCGLRSKILGETDIFGQIKESWQKLEKQNAAPGTISSLLVKQLKPWIQKLFEDTKDIRTRYIQGAGGFSYGSLVRLLLKPTPEDKILLIGAGKLALSVAPYLTDSQVLVWNRSREKLGPVLAEMAHAGAESVQVIDSDDRAGKDRAWSEATHVVLCVPLDEARDQERMQVWSKKTKPASKHGAILHLGCLRDEAGAWLRSGNFFCLDDLFELQKTQDKLREEQFRLARRACMEKTNLRLLGGSITLPHGWEDLALFG